jgi:hypothetical protein
MSVYYINPTVQIVSNKFENIMNNLINNISNLFLNNRNLIIEENYNGTIKNIMEIVTSYLKIYKFYDFDIKNIFIQIYNVNIFVVINLKIILSKSYFTFIYDPWKQFYLGLEDNFPIVYNGLNLLEQQTLNNSIINGDLYLNNIVLIEPNLKKGIILKNESINTDYITTLFW